MKLHVIFGQRHCDYDGQHAPEAIEVWDEYARDENPDGFLDQLELAKADSANFSAVRVIDIEVDGNKIARLLNATPVVKGEVQG